MKSGYLFTVSEPLNRKIKMEPDKYCCFFDSVILERITVR